MCGGREKQPETALFYGEGEVSWPTFWGLLLYQGHVTCATNWQASHLPGAEAC